jgi:branched-chain amino acid transport system ATP-binding protein
VLEGRQPFKYLTIEENLRVGTATRWGKPFRQDLEKVYHYFPALVERRKTLAGYCSGGEMQMLVIGRALMAHPKLLLLDEPSLGLAPLIVKEIFQIIERINRENGTTIVLGEQNATWPLQNATYGYVMENGRCDGGRARNSGEQDVKDSSWDGGGRTRSRYKDVKAYKRRKRWL